MITALLVKGTDVPVYIDVLVYAARELANGTEC